MFILEFAILIYSVILHEISHGFMADRLGDPTARLAGRLTLDPRSHIDPLMTIALPVLLLLTHAGIIFGAAKPVPIDPYNFREPKKDTALTALAGPVTNLLIAVALAIPARIFGPNEVWTTGIIWNVGLALFNLFPLPPLDGFKVLAGVLPDEIASKMYRWERFGFMIIFAILIFFPGLIFGPIYPLLTTITSLLLK